MTSDNTRDIPDTYDHAAQLSALPALPLAPILFAEHVPSDSAAPGLYPISALFNDGRAQPLQYPVPAKAGIGPGAAPYLSPRADTRTWGSAGWSAAAHYLDRLLRNRRGHRTAELLALAAHPAQTWSPEVAWLTKHLLLNAPAPLPLRRDRYDRMLTLLPGLAGLAGVTRAEVELPLRLREQPTGAHPYLVSQGIWD